MADDGDRRLRHWLWIWIGVGIVVVAVVAAFLFPIAGSLETIDDRLDRAGTNVEGVEQDVDTLPEHVARINEALEGIDDSLEPLPGQARAVIENLRSIEISLRNAEGVLNATASTLTTTSALLVETEARLNDTESTLNVVRHVLREVNTLAARTDATLERAERFDSLGTSGIWRRVRFLNGGTLADGRENARGLREVERDADRIESALVHIDEHLESICRGLPPLPNPDEPGLPGDSDTRADC